MSALALDAPIPPETLVRLEGLALRHNVSVTPLIDLEFGDVSLFIRPHGRLSFTDTPLSGSTENIRLIEQGFSAVLRELSEDGMLFIAGKNEPPADFHENNDVQPTLNQAPQGQSASPSDSGSVEHLESDPNYPYPFPSVHGGEIYSGLFSAVKGATNPDYLAGISHNYFSPESVAHYRPVGVDTYLTGMRNVALAMVNNENSPPLALENLASAYALDPTVADLIKSHPNVSATALEIIDTKIAESLAPRYPIVDVQTLESDPHAPYEFYGVYEGIFEAARGATNPDYLSGVTNNLFGPAELEAQGVGVNDYLHELRYVAMAIASNENTPPATVNQITQVFAHDPGVLQSAGIAPDVARQLFSVNGQVGGEGVTDIEFDASVERAAVMWNALIDTLDGEIPNLTPEAAFGFVSGIYAGSASNIPDTTWSAFFDANIGPDGTLPENLDLSMFAGMDATTVERMISDASVLFHSSQQAHQRVARDDLSFEPSAFHPPGSPQETRDAYLRALQNDLFQTGTSDYLTTRASTGDPQADALANSASQDFSLVGISADSIANGLVTREDLANHAGLKALMFVGNEIITELTDMGLWDGPSLAQLDGGDLASNPEFAVREVVYYDPPLQPGETREPTRALVTASQMAALQERHRQTDPDGKIQLVANQGISVFPSDPNVLEAAKLYSFSYVDQNGELQHIQDVPRAERDTYIAMHDNGEIAIQPQPIDDPVALSVFWRQHALAQYDAVRTPLYDDAGNVVSGQSAMVRLAQNYHQQYNHFEPAVTDTTTFNNRFIAGHRERTGSHISHLLNNDPLTAAPTLSDAEALDFLYSTMGLSSDQQNMSGFLSGIDDVTTTAHVAGYWAKNEHNHPDHTGFFGGIGNKARAENAVEDAKAEMAARGRGDGVEGNGLDNALSSVEEQIDLNRVIETTLDVFTIVSLGEAAAAFRIESLLERAALERELPSVVVQSIERAAAQGPGSLASELEFLSTKAEKLSLEEAARIQAAYAETSAGAWNAIGTLVGEQTAIGTARVQVIGDDGNGGTTELVPPNAQALDPSDTGGLTLQDQIMATNLALDIVTRHQGGEPTADLAHFLYNGAHEAHPGLIEQALEYLPTELSTALSSFHQIEAQERANLEALALAGDAQGLADAIAAKGSPQEQWAAYEIAFRAAQRRPSVPAVMVDTLAALPANVAANIINYEQSSILNGNNPGNLGDPAAPLNTSGPATATLTTLAESSFDATYPDKAGAILEQLASDAPGVAAHILLTVHDSFGGENTQQAATLLNTLIQRDGGEALAADVLAALDGIQSVHGDRRSAGTGGSVAPPDLVSAAILQELWQTADTTNTATLDKLANTTAAYVESSGFVTAQSLGEAVAAAVAADPAPSAGLLAYDTLLNQPFETFGGIFNQATPPSSHDIRLAAHGLADAYVTAPELVMAQLASHLATEPELVFSLLDELDNLPLSNDQHAEITQQLFGASVTEGRNFFGSNSPVNLSNQSEVAHVLGSLGPWGQAAFLAKINQRYQTADAATQTGISDALTGAFSVMTPEDAAQALLHYEHHIIELDNESVTPNTDENAGQDIVLGALVQLNERDPNQVGLILEHMAMMTGGPEITGHLITRASNLDSNTNGENPANDQGTHLDLEAGVRLLSTLSLINPELGMQVESSVDLTSQWAERLVGSPPRGADQVNSLWTNLLQAVEPAAWMINGILDAVDDYAGATYNRGMTYAALDALAALPYSAEPAIAVASAWITKEVTQYGLDVALQNLAPLIDQWINPEQFPETNALSRRAVGLSIGQAIEATVAAVQNQDPAYPQDALARLGTWLDDQFDTPQELALFTAEYPSLSTNLGQAAAEWTGTEPNPFLDTIALLPENVQDDAIAQLQTNQAVDFLDTLPDDQSAQRLIALTASGDAQEGLAIYNAMDPVEQQAMVAAGYDPVRAQNQADLEAALDRYQQIAQQNPSAETALLTEFEQIQQHYTALSTYVPGAASTQRQPGNIPLELNDQLMAVVNDRLGRFPAHYGDVVALADNSGQLRFHVQLRPGQSPAGATSLLTERLGLADNSLVTTSEDQSLATLLEATNYSVIGTVSQGAQGVGGMINWQRSNQVTISDAQGTPVNVVFESETSGTSGIELSRRVRDAVASARQEANTMLNQARDELAAFEANGLNGLSEDRRLVIYHAFGARTEAEVGQVLRQGVQMYERIAAGLANENLVLEEIGLDRPLVPGQLEADTAGYVDGIAGFRYTTGNINIRFYDYNSRELMSVEELTRWLLHEATHKFGGTVDIKPATYIAQGIQGELTAATETAALISTPENPVSPFDVPNAARYSRPGNPGFPQTLNNADSWAALWVAWNWPSETVDVSHQHPAVNQGNQGNP